MRPGCCCPPAWGRHSQGLCSPPAARPCGSRELRAQRPAACPLLQTLARALAEPRPGERGTGHQNRMAPGPLRLLPAPCQSTGSSRCVPSGRVSIPLLGLPAPDRPETRLAAIACLCPSAPSVPPAPVQSSAEGREQETDWGPVAAVLPCGEECVLSERPEGSPLSSHVSRQECARLSPPRCRPLSLSAAALHWESYAAL